MEDGTRGQAEMSIPSVRGFRDAVDTAFEVQVDPDTSVELTLEAMDEREARPGWEAFSLLFVGPAEPLPQNTYPVRHPNLGAFQLFVVPVAADDGGYRLEAVFNRPVT